MKRKKRSKVTLAEAAKTRPWVVALIPALISRSLFSSEMSAAKKAPKTTSKIHK